MVDAKLGVMDALRWDVDFTFAMEGIDFDEHGGICALETNMGKKGQLSRFPQHWPMLSKQKEVVLKDNKISNSASYLCSRSGGM